MGEGEAKTTKEYVAAACLDLADDTDNGGMGQELQPYIH